MSVSLHANLIIGMVMVCLLVLAVEGWHSWNAREVAIETVKVETANLTRSLSQHAHDLLLTTDAVLVDIRERVQFSGTSADTLDRLRRRMLQAIQTTPIIHAIFVYDADGTWVVNSTSVLAGMNNRDRAFFVYHQNHADPGPFIGPPIRSKSDGSLVITLSRRIDGADGKFAGVVAATVSVETLRSFYAQFDIGALGAISLLTQEGILLAREPAGGSPIGTDFSRSEIFRKFLPRAPSGNFEAIYASDGIRRLGNYQQVEGFPLVVIVARGLDGVLAGWRNDTLIQAVVTTLSVSILLIIGIRFAGQIKVTQQAEQRYRLLADHGNDAILCVGLDGERLYLSPGFSALTGWSAAEGLTLPWESFVHPDDRLAVHQTRAKVLLDGRPVTFALRYARTDGLHRWAEARVQVVAGTEDQKTQFVASLRDIHERKLAEDEIAALNARLALQAATDGLTALANRRRFDEALEMEWRRAAREGRSLSLLMIDVDRFKLYNDRYGHQKGDDCLRMVASVLSRFGRRAGDVVARYGGEEFAVMLPGAEAPAAAAIAEDVRCAIQEAALEHLDNQPGQVVTASIGAATLAPVPDNEAIHEKDLIAAADAALYEAKHQGRNRVVASAGAGTEQVVRDLAAFRARIVDARAAAEG